MIDRREWLRTVGAAAAVPLVNGLLPAELIAWGREVHAATGQSARSAIGADLMNTLSVVCERIIPTDETPGAIAAGVPQFVDRMLAGWYDPPDRRRVVSGLQELDQQAGARFGRAFADLTAAEQDTRLLALDAMGANSWFATVKYLTIWGYYTSEAGITQELRQPRAPGGYDGCAPYAPRPRAASLAQDRTAHAGKSHAAD